MLRAGRRLLRSGGRLAFFTISVAGGLSRADHRRAVAAGPPAPDGPHLPELLTRAGFVAVAERDVTADYLDAARGWLAARLRHRDVVRPLDPEMYDARIDQGRRSIAAIEAGLLRRTLLVGRVP